MAIKDERFNVLKTTKNAEKQLESAKKDKGFWEAVDDFVDRAAAGPREAVGNKAKASSKKR